MQTPPETTDTSTQKRQRVSELALVLAVAFLGSVAVSLYSLFAGPRLLANGLPQSGVPTALYGICNETTALALLAYVLSRRGHGPRQIGLGFSGRDIGQSLPVFLLAALASWLWEWLLYYGGYFLTGHVPDLRPKNVEFLSGPRTGAGFALLLVYGTINPFFEELIVRAYLMSEVLALTGRAGLAVLASVGLQVSYHFYQGAGAALVYIPPFLVFACYYARTRRILPVILAHLYFDWLALLWHS